MKQLIILLATLFLTVANNYAQPKFTPYDELPGIDKIVKPSYNASYSGFQKMLYEYPVNFFDIENKYNQYINTGNDKKTPIIRYFKIWRRAVQPYVNSKGEIEVPNISTFENNLLNSQKNAATPTKSVTNSNSNWTFLGPKETFWRNENGIGTHNLDENGNPKQCPWQVNVYAFDVAACNSSLLYCGTETGFVNKTTDKGETWKQMGKNYPFGGGITAIAIHPTKSENVYVSGGKQIHKTTDGGQTWSPLLPAPEKFGAVRLKINPVNTDTLIAASSDGFYWSTDAGSSWDRRWSKSVWDVEFNPANPDEVYALSKNSGGKYQVVVSKNGGSTFSVDSNFPTNFVESSGGLLAVTPANPNILYVTLMAKENDGDAVYIYKGTKSGDNFNWTQTKKGAYRPPNTHGGGEFTVCQGYFDLVMEASPTNADILFWGTCSFWKSTDGGQSFTKIGGYGGDFPVHPDIQDLKILENGETWLATDGGMNYSTDLFSNWENYSSRTKGIIGSDMWGFDQGWNEDIVVGGRYHNGNTAIADFYGNKSLRMGGAESPTGWVIQGKSRHVAFNDLGNGWILPKNAEDVAEGRFSFSKFPNMDEYGGRRSNLLHHPNYYSTLYLGEGNGFWKSTDMGESFELLHQFPDKVRYCQISHKNPNIIYIDVVGKGLYRSADGGKSWEQKDKLTNGQYGNSTWNGKLFFVISPYDENKIYACLSNGTWSSSYGKIFKSTDGGDTWNDWTNGVEEFTKCMVIQPTSNGKDLVYLFTTSKNGQAAKVFSRYENQPYWNNYDTNYPLGIDVNLAMPFYRDAKLRVAGNAGVWESAMLDTVFTPVVSPWTEKRDYNCMLDTVYFDDHSILNHKGACWNWEITPEPEYISSVNTRNPKVVLGNPGAYDVTLNITQNENTYSKTIEEMVTTTTCPSVIDCNNPDYIDKSLWSLIYTDSQETVGEKGYATNAFDDDPSTFWHTEWYYKDPVQPHELQIDLGKEYSLSKFEYLPRQNSSNGRIKAYELYISVNNSNWGNPVASGSFEGGSGVKKLAFESVSGRYIKFKSLSEQNNNTFTTIAEMDFMGCIPNNTVSAKTIEFEKLEAYPIPANDQLTISLPASGISKSWEYQIYSATGNVIEKNHFESIGSTYNFDLNKCNTGLYFIILKNMAGVVFRIKFIKE